MNCFLKIGETDVSDLVAGLKLSYQTLFGNEATNAQGRRVMDVIEGKRVSPVSYTHLDVYKRQF